MSDREIAERLAKQCWDLLIPEPEGQQRGVFLVNAEEKIRRAIQEAVAERDTELRNAQNEAAQVRRHYLHEKVEREKAEQQLAEPRHVERAVKWLREYMPTMLREYGLPSLAALIAEVEAENTCVDCKDYRALVRREERERAAREIEAEARSLPIGTAFGTGPLAYTSMYNVMMWAVARLRRLAEPEEPKP